MTWDHFCKHTSFRAVYTYVYTRDFTRMGLVVQLVHSYRAHARLIEFPNQHFYAGTLVPSAVPSAVFFQYLGARRRLTPTTCVGLNVPTNASHRDLSDATLPIRSSPSALAVGMRRKVVQK